LPLSFFGDIPKARHAAPGVINCVGGLQQQLSHRTEWHRTIDAMTAIASSLFDPAMDHCRARLKLPGQFINAASGARRRNKLFP